MAVQHVPREEAGAERSAEANQPGWCFMPPCPSVEARERELAQACGIVENVDLDDPSVRDREGHDREGTALGHHDDFGGSVHQRPARVDPEVRDPLTRRLKIGRSIL